MRSLLPWLIFRADGTQIGRTATRQGAMNRVDRPYQRGLIRIRHERSLEEWARRYGSWEKTRAAAPVRRRMRPAAAPAPSPVPDSAREPAAPEEEEQGPWWIRW